MSNKSLAVWFAVAVLLGAGIAVNQRFGHRGPPHPEALLPKLKASAVTGIQLWPQGQPKIRLERTNGLWRLTEPMVYPAQGASIETLLSALERLAPTTYITPAELKSGTNPDQEFGFKHPQVSMVLYQGDYQPQLLVGAATAPGDQLFVQVVGNEGIYVVNADLLQLIPRSLNDLRDTTFVRLSGARFDRVCVTNLSRVIELEREQGFWRLSRPSPARANQALIDSLLQKLESVRINGFISDQADADLDAFGLQPPQLELSFKLGTNLLALLQFGKALTNDPAQVYARRSTQPGIVAVSKEALDAWRGSPEDLRDPHVVRLNEPVNEIRIVGEREFAVVQTNQSWRVMPDNWPADPAKTTNLLDTLARMRIVEFTKDVVTPIDLAGFGLANPTRKYILLSAATSTNEPATNRPIVEIQFGTNTQNKIYVRRTDENSIYAVQMRDFLALPASAVQLRLKQVWDVNEDDLLGVTIRNNGKTRQLLRKARHEWSLAPGSQGVINDLAIEESVRPLCHLVAAEWLDRGAARRSAFGFTDTGLQVTLDLKNGQKLALEFGSPVEADSGYASVTLEGEPWILQLQPAIYRFATNYLSIPADTP